VAVETALDLYFVVIHVMPYFCTFVLYLTFIVCVFMYSDFVVGRLAVDLAH
jgi:hypothetical protein